MDLDKQIEAVLFWKGEPVALKRLADFVKREEKEVEEALAVLGERLKEGGITLQRIGDEVTLGTAPEMSKSIEALAKEELDRELSKATLETLSIILYKSPIRRSEIDFIRGVNSTFILRNLLIRGLIQKISDPKDERAYLYIPSFELFSFLGISKADELPEFKVVQEELLSWREERDKTVDSSTVLPNTAS